MKKIYKYVINKRTKSIELPIGFKILSAQEQHDDISIWMEVNPDVESQLVSFKLVMTDEEVPEGYTYVNSIQMTREYTFVYHVYYKVV